MSSTSRASQPAAVLVAMVLAILAITSLAVWDSRRESAASLADFAQEQVSIATAAAAAVGALLNATRGEEVSTERILSMLRPIERPGSLSLLVRRPGASELVTTSGGSVFSPALANALVEGVASLRVNRSETAALGLGLPERTSMAGLRVLDGGAAGSWAIVVIATAERERDREDRAKWRLLLGVTLASGLVLAFGGIALRKQRRQLELASALAVAEVQRGRDDRLVRADKLATMGALATGVAHEVSTPLGVIMGRAEQLLPQVSGDERATHALAVIVEQAERISTIIRGFLRLARGGAPCLEHVDPNALARKAVDLVEHRFAKAGVHLATDAPAKLPLVACEPRLFEQVLANLLLNACDACASGGEVDLRVRHDGDRVVFVVDDDGAGITPEAAARAAEPFFTTKAPGEGTGLGLAIATEIVKNHQGTLRLAPHPGGRGTRASVEIPAIET